VCDAIDCPASKPLSVCIALDESGSVCSIGQPNQCAQLADWNGQGNNQCDYANNCPSFNAITKDFTKTLIQGLDAVSDNSEFSIVTFGRHATVDAALSPANVALDTVDELVYSGGWTNTQAAIMKCREQLDDAPAENLKVLVLITDGLPTNNRADRPKGNCNICKGETISEANIAKDNDITLISVGVGSVSFDQDFLKEIASDDSSYIAVTDYDDLNMKIDDVNRQANVCLDDSPKQDPTVCSTDECGVCNGPGKITCCDGTKVCDAIDCPASKPLSVCIALDESGSVCSIGQPNQCAQLADWNGQGNNQCDYANNCPSFNAITKDFTKTLIQGLDAVSDNSEFSIVTFGRHATVDAALSPANVALDTVDELVYSGGWTNTQAAIMKCREQLDDAPAENLKVLVLITDGLPTNNRADRPKGNCNICKGETISEANIAKDNDITLISVGVGSVSFDQDFLKEIASDDSSYIAVTDYDDLNMKIDDVNRQANVCLDDS